VWLTTSLEGTSAMQITADLTDGDLECAGCGLASIAPQALERVFCPDCAREHTFCEACADDAVQLLAA
jgi:hypothetical protein